MYIYGKNIHVFTIYTCKFLTWHIYKRNNNDDGDDDDGDDDDVDVVGDDRKKNQIRRRFAEKSFKLLRILWDIRINWNKAQENQFHLKTDFSYFF